MYVQTDEKGLAGVCSFMLGTASDAACNGITPDFTIELR